MLWTLAFSLATIACFKSRVLGYVLTTEYKLSSHGNQPNHISLLPPTTEWVVPCCCEGWRTRRQWQHKFLLPDGCVAQPAGLRCILPAAKWPVWQTLRVVPSLCFSAVPDGCHSYDGCVVHMIGSYSYSQLCCSYDSCVVHMKAAIHIHSCVVHMMAVLFIWWLCCSYEGSYSYSRLCCSYERQLFNQLSNSYGTT